MIQPFNNSNQPKNRSIGPKKNCTLVVILSYLYIAFYSWFKCYFVMDHQWNGQSSSHRDLLTLITGIFFIEYTNKTIFLFLLDMTLYNLCAICQKMSSQDWLLLPFRFEIYKTLEFQCLTDNKIPSLPLLAYYGHTHKWVSHSIFRDENCWLKLEFYVHFNVLY